MFYEGFQYQNKALVSKIFSFIEMKYVFRYTDTYTCTHTKLYLSVFIT